MSINRRMDKEDVVYIYSAIKKNEIMPFAVARMDLKTVILSEVRERQIPCNIAHMWNLKGTYLQKQK